MSTSVVRFGLLIAILAMLSLSAAATVAAEPDPLGVPAGMKAGQTFRWYVWNDGKEWHVRTTTKDKEQHFEFVIQVTDDIFTDVTYPGKGNGTKPNAARVIAVVSDPASGHDDSAGKSPQRVFPSEVEVAVWPRRRSVCWPGFAATVNRSIGIG
jgi:hypothetical protein